MLRQIVLSKVNGVLCQVLKIEITHFMHLFSFVVKVFVRALTIVKKLLKNSLSLF